MIKLNKPLGSATQFTIDSIALDPLRAYVSLYTDAGVQVTSGICINANEEVTGWFNATVANFINADLSAR